MTQIRGESKPQICLDYSSGNILGYSLSSGTKLDWGHMLLRISLLYDLIRHSVSVDNPLKNFSIVNNSQTGLMNPH